MKQKIVTLVSIATLLLFPAFLSFAQTLDTAAPASDATATTTPTATAEETTAPADATPPVISGVAVYNITTSDATITWNTNEAATSQVEYGTTSGYGSLSSPDVNLVTAHALSVGSLTPSTLYHYRVWSRDASGNAAVSPDAIVNTAAGPSQSGLVLSAIVAGQITTNSVELDWTTNVASSSKVEYGRTSGYAVETIDSLAVTAHRVLLYWLSAATTYHYRLTSQDGSGNSISSTDLTFRTAGADTTPPVITSVLAPAVTSTGATMSWTTDEASSSQVEYGSTVAYGQQTVLDAVLVTAHTQMVTGLQAGTTYHYRVRSVDAAGNVGVSGDATMTAAAASDTTAPTVPGALSVVVGGSTQVTLNWVASTDSGGSGLAGYRVERCSGSGCSGYVVIGTAAGTSYADS